MLSITITKNEDQANSRHRYHATIGVGPGCHGLGETPVEALYIAASVAMRAEISEKLERMNGGTNVAQG